ncbi:hypothetical protein DVH05_025614 [Phytophthora capsici]|nr:hypothetical protein DVH05_025614 [Phytophthora capsici]
MPWKRSLQLTLDRFLVGSEEDRFKRTRFSENLLLDTRSIVQAYGEYNPITKNVYMSRPRATLSEEDIPLCGCRCQDGGERPCETSCENRSMNVECVAGRCSSNTNCSNQRFQEGSSVSLSLALCGQKGIGLVAEQRIEKDSFIIEYTGEVIPRGDYYKRYANRPGTRNYYGVQSNTREVIDATQQGSMARFANHSCAPNCNLECWDVNGEACCGLFAACTIQRGEEITFCYAGTRMGKRTVSCK